MFALAANSIAWCDAPRDGPFLIQVPLGPNLAGRWFMSQCSASSSLGSFEVVGEERTVEAPSTKKVTSKARKVRFYCVFSVGPKALSLNTKLEAGIFCTAWADLKKLLPDECLAGSGIRLKRFDTLDNALEAFASKHAVERSEIKVFDDELCQQVSNGSGPTGRRQVERT